MFIVSLVAFVVVCEHLLPMLIVRRDPEQVLDVLLPVFHPLARLLTPLTAALLAGSRRPPRARARRAATATAPRRRRRASPDAADDEGEISEEEGRELLQSIVDFTETVVREVMTPRPDIVAVSADATLQDLRALFREEQYSRMPVYRDNLDNIVGIVFVKDLVALPPGAEPPLTTLMRSAYFVPESKRVSELLKEMQRRQAQMAIVVDEYGGTAGLVTVEDLLEEIVGEIRDEYDVESETVTDEGNGTFVFSGKVSVDEVRDRLGVEIEREGFETVGGYCCRISAGCRTSARRSRSTTWRSRCSRSSAAGSPRCACAAASRRRASSRGRACHASPASSPSSAGPTPASPRCSTASSARSWRSSRTSRRRRGRAIVGVKNYAATAQVVFVDTPGVHKPTHRMNVADGGHGARGDARGGRAGAGRRRVGQAGPRRPLHARRC